MKIILNTLISLCILSLVKPGLAQNTIPSTGGNASGSGGSVSYSVGQVVFTTSSSSVGSVSQGVQQPYEISVVTGLEEAKDIILSYSAYPNPVTDYLTLKIENYEYDNFSIRLFDSNGKLLQSKKLTGIETTISMTNLLPSLYFLKIIENQKEIKTFKIIKK